MVLKFLVLTLVVAAIAMGEQQNKSLERHLRKKNKACEALEGKCMEPDENCPGDLPSETEIGHPFCRGQRRCCYKGNGSACPAGYYHVAALNKCIIPAEKLSFKQALKHCRKKGLQLLQPDHPITLRDYIKVNAESYYDEMWVDGRGNGSTIVKSNGQPISNDDEHWYPGQPKNFRKKYCLELMVYNYYHPYYEIKCKSRVLMTWCEIPATPGVIPLETTIAPIPNAATSAPDYEAFPGRFWSYYDCPYTGKYQSLSLDECKFKCTQDVTCTCVIFRPDIGFCRTVKCSKPVPPPTQLNSDFTGYAKLTGK